MSHWQRIHYAVSIAIIVTALSWFFFAQGGSLFLTPGFFFEVLLGFVIIIDPEEILLTERAWGGSVIVYSVSFYALSWVLSSIRGCMQKLRPIEGEI